MSYHTFALHHTPCSKQTTTRADTAAESFICRLFFAHVLNVSLSAPPSLYLQRILEEQRRQDEKRRVKRAANRKSASTSRARKKAYVDDMTAKNERMKQHALILSMLPDLVLAVCRSGEMTYVSPACQWLLLHAPEEVTGANIFELVTQDCHSLLRKMISEHLSRPVQSLREAADSNAWSDEAADRSDGGSCCSGGETVRPAATSSAGTSPPQGLGNHRDRLQQRYRQGQEQASSCGGGGGGSVKEGGRVGGVRIATPLLQGPKLLRLIRRDRTTVWCETRLSVRNAKNDSATPMPIEIILTLRTVSEGNNISAAHGLPGARAPVLECGTSSPGEANIGGIDNDNDDEYVEDDDDGYRCEEEEEDSNNSGSGNDSGSRHDNVGCQSAAGGRGRGVKHAIGDETDPDPVAGTRPLPEKREELSLSKKRQRMENMMTSGAADDNKPGDREEDSSTGGDTGGSTTQEGSASGSNEADSNGEGSNNGSSKWGEGCEGDNNGSPCRDYGGSEDGSSDGSSAGADLGEQAQIQDAVQSLILMGGSFSSDGVGQ